MSRTRITLAATVTLWFVVLAGALATVHARHDARKAFVELQQLQHERDELDIEWGRLRIEQSAHATHALIESVARDELQMAVPAAGEIVILREP